MIFPFSIASEISSKDTLRCPFFNSSFFSGFQLYLIYKYTSVCTKSQYFLYAVFCKKASRERIETAPIPLYTRFFREFEYHSYL